MKLEDVGTVEPRVKITAETLEEVQQLVDFLADRRNHSTRASDARRNLLQEVDGIGVGYEEGADEEGAFTEVTLAFQFIESDSHIGASNATGNAFSRAWDFLDAVRGL